MKYDLKRCPRCGNKAEPVCDEERESIHRENVVECCKCALCTDGYATVEEAVQAWNTREIKGNSIDLGYEDWDGIDITEFGKWISVKDKLPERKNLWQKREWYLVALENGVVTMKFYEFDNDTCFGEGWNDCPVDVTHWMPLPEPPKK